MVIKGKDKVVQIPNWVIVVGLLAADSIICNLCNTALGIKRIKEEEA